MSVPVISDKIVENLKSKYSSYNIAEFALFHRTYDDSYEILGLISDPTIEPQEFFGREILFPKKWVTLDVVPMENFNEY